jgi:hypothetical protein
MTTLDTFEVQGSFKLTHHGLVVFGDIINGTVSVDNFLTFNNGKQDVKLKIKGVNFLDNIKKKISKVALTFNYKNDMEMENLQMLKVTKHTATISKF